MTTLPLPALDGWTLGSWLAALGAIRVAGQEWPEMLVHWGDGPILTNGPASLDHLAAQPKLADREHVRPDRDLVRAYSRAGREPCEVLLVDLRRRYVPNQGSNPEADLNRQYRHRWVVSGHWRDQACGKEWSERKRIWVSNYVKGPDGAPLLATTRVNVWRR